MKHIMRLFAFICSELLATVSIQMIKIVFVVQNQASIVNTVRWKRETNPVLFGRNVTLTCIVGRKEGCVSTATRRWDAGNNRNTLLLNGFSTNSSKYYEISEEPCQNFSMVIMQFDLNDVDREYWCSFGFETSRHILMLDDQHFIGVPVKTDIYSSLGNDEQRELHLRISFYKVYPKPKCKTKIGDTSWVPVTVVSHSIGKVYNSSVHNKTTVPKSQCHNNVTIICSLLSYTILQLNKRLNCTDTVMNREDTSMMVMVIMTVLVIVAVSILGFACFLRKKKNLEASQKNKFSTVERLNENEEETTSLNC